MSEEQYRLRALRAFMSDENVVDRGRTTSRSRASGTSMVMPAAASASSRPVPIRTRAAAIAPARARDYLREHRAHAEMSDSQSVEATRKAHSVTIGEVSSRTHQQGESEDHFEASSREFVNPNHCHAVTFLFYRINKTETIKFELVSIQRRVLDPVAPMPVAANPFRPVGQIATIPQEVPATNLQRVATLDRTIERPEGAVAGVATAAGWHRRFAHAISSGLAVAISRQSGLGEQTPLGDALRETALKVVNDQLHSA